MGKMYLSAPSKRVPKRVPVLIKRKKNIARVPKNKLRNLVQPAKQHRAFTGSFLNLSNPVGLGVTHLIGYATGIDRGDQVNQRDGQAVFVKGINIKCTMNNSGTKGRGFRIAVVSPITPAGGAIPTNLTDIFTNNLFSVQPYDKLSGSLVFPINRTKYKVYYDRVFNIMPESSVGGNRLVEKYVKINRRAIYQSAVATSIVQGGLYVLVMPADWDNNNTNIDNVVNLYTTTYFRDAHYQWATY